MVIVQGYAGLGRLLGISKQAVRQYVTAGMPVHQVGLHAYFDTASVIVWLTDRSPRHANLAHQLAQRVAAIQQGIAKSSED